MSTFFIYLKGENAPPSLIIEMLFECDALKAALVLHCGNSMEAPPFLEWCQGQPQLRSSGALQK